MSTTTANMQKMTIKQLKTYCKDHHIVGYSGLCKNDIINIILNKPIPIKKEYALITEDLRCMDRLQSKKVDELRYICRQIGISIYKKTKSTMIAQILQKSNEMNKNPIYSNGIMPKIIRGQLYGLDSDDESQETQDITSISSVSSIMEEEWPDEQICTESEDEQ